MRKLTIICILIILIPVLLFARNGQKVIPLESDVYGAIDMLYLLEGKALPSTTRPWTTAEAEKILSKVSERTSPELYAIVSEAITELPRLAVDELFKMSFRGYASITGYAHTNTDFRYPFNGMTNYLFSADNEKPTFQGSWEAWAGDHIYSFVWYQYKNNFNADKFSSYNFNFNIANLTPEGFTSDLDQREPSRAFAVAGGEGWSIEIGRDRLAMGTGVSGSLILSNTFPYHNLLRFSLFGTKYKYSFVMSFLPHMADENRGILYYMTHRFECRFLSDSLYIAANESIMYKNDNGNLDVRYVNPVMYFHNYFISGLANSIVDFEASWSFSKGWNLYFQFALDQFVTPWEIKDGDRTDPLAFGALIGLTHVSRLGNGYLTLSAEGAYTMPYLYLRATNIPPDQHVQPQDDPGLGYIGLYRGNRFFLGYTYGNDAVVFNIRGTYKVVADLEISADLLFMLNGEKNIWSLFDMADKSFAPSGDYTLFWFAELNAKKYFSESFDIYARYDLVSSSGIADNQFVIGMEKRF